MKRLLVALLAGVIVFAAVYAAAAGMTLRALALGSSQQPVLSCDTSLTFAFTLGTDNKISQVTISDIAPECAGGSLSLALTNSSNVAIGNGTGVVPAGGGSMDVAISALPNIADVVHEQVVIVGP